MSFHETILVFIRITKMLEHSSVRAPKVARNRKKTLSQLIFNNPRHIILPGSAPDPKCLLLHKWLPKNLTFLKIW